MHITFSLPLDQLRQLWPSLSFSLLSSRAFASMPFLTQLKLSKPLLLKKYLNLKWKYFLSFHFPEIFSEVHSNHPKDATHPRNLRTSMIQMRRTVERNEAVAEHPDKPDCFLRLNIILTIPSTPLLKVQIVGTTKSIWSALDPMPRNT